MPLSIDIKPIPETAQEIPRVIEMLQSVLLKFRQVWLRGYSPTKQNRRSQSAKTIERR